MEAVNAWQGAGLIFVLSLFVEAIIEYFIPSFPPRWKWAKRYLAAALAITVALAYNADLLAAMGLPSVAYVGPVLTGLILGRGSNFLATFYKQLQVVTAPAQTVATVPGLDDPDSPST